MAGRILIGQKNAIVTMDLCESWGVTSDESSETPDEWSETSEECPELEEHTVSSREENPIVGRGVKAMTPATTTVHQGDKEGRVGSTQPKRQRLS